MSVCVYMYTYIYIYTYMYICIQYTCMIYHQIPNSVPLIPIPQLQTIPDTLRDLGIDSSALPFPVTQRVWSWSSSDTSLTKQGPSLMAMRRIYAWLLHWVHTSQGVSTQIFQDCFLPWFYPWWLVDPPQENFGEFKKWIMIPDSNGDLKKCAKAPCPDTQYNTHAAGNVLGRYRRNRPRLPMSKKMCKSIWIAQTQSSSGKPAGLGKNRWRVITWYLITAIIRLYNVSVYVVSVCGCTSMLQHQLTSYIVPLWYYTGLQILVIIHDPCK